MLHPCVPYVQKIDWGIVREVRNYVKYHHAEGRTDKDKSRYHIELNKPLETLLGDRVGWREVLGECGFSRSHTWNSVVFYNYLQTPMLGPRQAGNKTDYANAAEAFFEVLEQYHPEYIIVWGYRLWDALSSDRWEWGEELMLDGKPVRTGCYLLADGTRIEAAPVKHPSAGYSWDK